MNTMHIEKGSKGKFSITWDDFPDEELNLDFNPLLKEFDLVGIILHWQSRPKSTKNKQGRCWGLYDIEADSYFAGTADNIPPFKVRRCRVLDIPEYKSSSVPTAVIYFPGLKAREVEGTILVF